MYLSKEDYEEPRCPLSRPDFVEPIPVRRVIEKLDEHLGRSDYSAAQRHLEYWLEESEARGDEHGKLTILNEQIGLYRKTGKEAEAIQTVEAALALADELGIDGTAAMGTTLINAGTAYKAFGKAGTALPLFRRAREIYEAILTAEDRRLGGLYNNMALTVMELEDYKEASKLFEKALRIMSKVEHGEADMAITYCNLADLAAAEPGVADKEQIICGYLDKAKALLDTESLPRNGYYAFVCEKCAPTFGYYGYHAAEREFLKRSREIYENG